MSRVIQKLTRYQKNRDVILKRAKEYYKKNKEKRRQYRKKQIPRHA